jgi:hypothetical protein
VSEKSKNIIVLIVCALMASVAVINLLVTASHKNYRGRQQYESNKDACSAKLRRLGYNEASDGSEQKNSADMCAQLRSAEAADESAFFGRLQVVSGWINFLFVTAATIAAGLAAYFTKQTAEAGRHAIVETRRIGEAQTRAYLGIEGLSGTVLVGKSVRFEISIKNFGHSPAMNVAVASNVVVRPIDWSRDSEHDGAIVGERTATAMHPGGQIVIIASIEPATTLTVDIFNGIKSGTACVFAIVQIFYEDVFERKWEACFCIEFSGDECFSTGKPRISKNGNYYRQCSS